MDRKNYASRQMLLRLKSSLRQLESQRLLVILALQTELDGELMRVETKGKKRAVEEKGRPGQ